MATGLPRRRSPAGRGARERILQASRVLFRQRGITATGVAELAAAAQVSKRTLYQHFAGKDELVVAYLRECELDRESGAARALGRSDLTPRARLLELFATLADEPHPLRGCPFVNAAVELPDPRHPVHRAATEHKRRFTEQLAGLAREAGARDPDRVGRRLALLYDGAATQAVVFDNADGIAEAHRMAAAILDQAIQ